MPFIGQDHVIPEVKTLVDKSPQKRFSVVIDGYPGIISCDYVNFHAAHISFWRRNPDEGKQDTLVTCIKNELVDELKEVDL